MDLRSYTNYPLPMSVRNAFGVETAQQLADQLGAKGTFTREMAHEAESVYSAYRRGDTDVVRRFLSDRLGLSDDTITDAMGKLSTLS